MKGFSKELLKNHFGLYEGYVKNANKLLETLASLQEQGKMPSPEFSEIQRRLSFELNGIKLHEYYFENMNRDGGRPDKESSFYKKVTAQFGDYKKWENHFRAVAVIRGIGWALTVYDAKTDRLLNTWVDEHHLGHVAGTWPVVVCDLWEHAMLLDYGSDREKYLNAFFEVIDWSAAAGRLEKAAELQEMHQV